MRKVLYILMLLALNFEFLSAGNVSDVVKRSRKMFSDVSIAPNVSDHTLTIKFPTDYLELKVSVTDVLGRDVYHTIVRSPELHIDLSCQEKGLYFVKIESSTSDSRTEKFLLR